MAEIILPAFFIPCKELEGVGKRKRTDFWEEFRIVIAEVTRPRMPEEACLASVPGHTNGIYSYNRRK